MLSYNEKWFKSIFIIFLYETLYNERCKTGYVILFDESQCGIGYDVVQFILDAIAVLIIFFVREH